MLRGHEDDLVRDDARREREERRVVKEDGAQPAAGHARPRPRTSRRCRRGAACRPARAQRGSRGCRAPGTRSARRQPPAGTSNGNSNASPARTSTERPRHLTIDGSPGPAPRGGALRTANAWRDAGVSTAPVSRQQLAVLPARSGRPPRSRRAPPAFPPRRRLPRCRGRARARVRAQPAAARDDDGELHNCARAWEAARASEAALRPAARRRVRRARRKRPRPKDFRRDLPSRELRISLDRTFAADCRVAAPALDGSAAATTAASKTRRRSAARIAQSALCRRRRSSPSRRPSRCRRRRRRDDADGSRAAATEERHGRRRGRDERWRR